MNKLGNTLKSRDMRQHLMNSGKMSRKFLCVLLMLAWLLPATSHSEDALEGILARVATRGGGKALFVETQYLAMFKQPQKSSGELLFLPPDHLEKVTLEPKRESIVIDSGMLTFTRRGKSRSLALSAHPQVGIFVESIRATLAGDRAALEKHFRLEFSGDAERWRLSLEPKDSQLSRVLHKILVGGREDVVESFEMLRTDGDRSVLSVALQTNR